MNENRNISATVFQLCVISLCALLASYPVYPIWICHWSSCLTSLPIFIPMPRTLDFPQLFFVRGLKNKSENDQIEHIQNGFEPYHDESIVCVYAVPNRIYFLSKDLFVRLKANTHTAHLPHTLTHNSSEKEYYLPFYVILLCSLLCYPKKEWTIERSLHRHCHIAFGRIQPRNLGCLFIDRQIEL